MRTLLLGMLLTARAFAQKIQIESDGAVDFKQFKTFAIREERLNSTNPALNNELTKKHINADIQSTPTFRKPWRPKD